MHACLGAWIQTGPNPCPLAEIVLNGPQLPHTAPHLADPALIAVIGTRPRLEPATPPLLLLLALARFEMGPDWVHLPVPTVP